MKITKEQILSTAKTIGIFLLAALFGWLITYPIRSEAATQAMAMSEASESAFYSFFLTMISTILPLTVLLVVLKNKNTIFKVIIKWFDGVKRMIENRFGAKVLAIDNAPMVLVTSPVTVEADDDLASAKALLLKKHAQLGKSYSRISDSNEKAQKSGMSQKDKERSASLYVLARNVLDHLIIIESLGQLNTQEILGTGSNQVYGEKTHKEKGEAKLKEIELAMFIVMSEHASKISSSIDEIKLPESYEIEDRLEAVRSEGERLLAILDSSDTPVSSESEFVLRKVVGERIDELWEGYIQAKESYFEKQVELLDLGSTKKINPDLAIKEALTDIEAIFKEVDTSIKTSRENKAIDGLMITKSYFNNR